MKISLLAVALFFPVIATATVQERMIRVFCGSQADLTLTLQKYHEVPVIIATNNSDLHYSVWANLETQTSTWIVKTPEPDTYCVMGAGEQLTILSPEDTKSKIKNKKHKRPQY